MNPLITEHAKRRMRQRGFSSRLVDMIVDYGRYQPAPGGAFKIALGGRSYQELVTRLKKDLQLLDSAKGGTLILSADGQILTTYKNK